jgi:formylglycine-generating enzyme required for sulfatase activity
MSREKQPRGVGVHRVLVALTLFVFLAAPLQQAAATDPRISNFWRHPYSGGNGEVEFDLAWDNSWRVTPPLEPYNWDAVWIFAKIRINGGDWAPLKFNMTGHTIPAGFTHTMGLVDTGAAHNASTNPAVGMFVYRSSDGFGTASVADMRLQWSYADNGASSGDAVEVRPIAVEMVYIPEGAFYAGDGSPDSGGSTSRLKEGSADTDPWHLGSEISIGVTNAASDGYYYVSSGWSGESSTGSSFTIPAAFPKGYGAYYIMKGEVSQGQWVALFNMLTDTQKSTRDITGGVLNTTGKASDGLVNRNNVSWTSGDATLPDQGGGATYSGAAMNFLTWADLTAYLDWAGLRPMSELEYEKAGRGSRGVSSPIAAVSGEYAWGSTSIAGATSISNSGLTNERGQTGSNIACNNVAGVQGPLRVGGFAQAGSNRISVGGGFYGALELSGNVWERSVTVGNSNGRAFESRYHGNGVLGSTGNPDVTSWPGPDAVGSGWRGGAWNAGNGWTRLSDRYFAALTSGNRSSSFGGRGVRSAP